MRILLCFALFIGLVGPGVPPMTTTMTYQIITPDGVTFDLNTTTSCGYTIYGLENIGMPPVRTYTHTVPGQPGVVLDDMLDDARTITVMHTATGADIDDVFENMNDVMANYRYNRTATLQPLRLRVTFNAKSADLYCYYGGMITSKIDNIHALYGFTLVAYDPYWYATSESSTALDSSDTLAVHYILGKVDGLWTAMSDPAATALTSIWCMAQDASGDLYVGGTFTDFDGIAAADNIAKYDVSAGTWSAVGATPLSGAVYSIAIAANGDIYIGGGFGNAGGDADADYIAVLRSGAADWVALTAAGQHFNSTVSSLCLTNDGYLWAGGSFDDAGGTAAECIAYMAVGTPGTWYAAAGLDNTSDTVRVIVQGLDDTIYIGGTFINLGGDTDADFIAQWTGAAWANAGGPANSDVYALAVGSDGRLYAGGNFTTWGGVTCNYIGVWDGSAVSAMEGGVDAVVYKIHIANDNSVYIAGTFTTAGGVAIFDHVARWNGLSWQAIPINIPGAPTWTAIYTIGDDLFIAFDTSGNAYVPGDANVTYAGNVAFPPTITIVPAAAASSCTLRSIRNETTGVEILANLFIAKDETITIDLGDPGEIPAGKSVTSSWAARPNANNLLGKILSPTALTRFSLAPAPIAAAGVNLINCKTTDGAATMTCYFWNRYDSLQAALD